MTYDSSILGFQYHPFGILCLSWSPDFQKLAVTLAAVCIRGNTLNPKYLGKEEEERNEKWTHKNSNDFRYLQDFKLRFLGVHFCRSWVLHFVAKFLFSD
jgi:hypothetical protein